jgi:hypothetical protein
METEGLPFEYRDEKENCLLQIYKEDEDIHLVTVDFEMDIYYEWIIKPGQKPEKLIIGSPFNVTDLE